MKAASAVDRFSSLFVFELLQGEPCCWSESPMTFAKRWRRPAGFIQYDSTKLWWRSARTARSRPTGGSSRGPPFNNAGPQVEPAAGFPSPPWLLLLLRRMLGTSWHDYCSPLANLGGLFQRSLLRAAMKMKYRSGWTYGRWRASFSWRLSELLATFCPCPRLNSRHLSYFSRDDRCHSCIINTAADATTDTRHG